MPEPNDINTRLEKFYTEHPEARPAHETMPDLRLRLWCERDWVWQAGHEGSYPRRSCDMNPTALHRDALVQWLTSMPRACSIDGDVGVILGRDGNRIADWADLGSSSGPVTLEALLAAAEAVGGEG